MVDCSPMMLDENDVGKGGYKNLIIQEIIKILPNVGGESLGR